jgi:hypothetical protein
VPSRRNATPVLGAMGMESARPVVRILWPVAQPTSEATPSPTTAIPQTRRVTPSVLAAKGPEGSSRSAWRSPVGTRHLSRLIGSMRRQVDHQIRPPSLAGHDRPFPEDFSLGVLRHGYDTRVG